MAEYPRLPVRRRALGHRQFSLQHLMLGCASVAIGLECILVGELPRLLTGIVGSLLLAITSAAVLSRLQPMTAMVIFAHAALILVLCAFARSGSLPTLHASIRACLDSKESDGNIVVLTVAWFGLLLLFGLGVGCCLAILRTEFDEGV